MGNCNECAEQSSFEYEADFQNMAEAEKLELLGVGSFARVYKVMLKSYEHEEEPSLKKQYFNQPLALKEFTKAYIMNKDDAELANIEVKLLKTVTPHPFITEFIRCFQDEDRAYILMEHVPCGDLLYHMKIEKKSSSNGRLTEEQVKFMCGCLVLAISHIHDKGIVHRDIKPENVMIDDQGYPKLGDFGVADFKKDIQNNNHFGTLAYMAPEMILKEGYSYSADYYSLGVLLLLLLTGDMFAVGKTVEEASKHVLKRRRTLTMKKLKKRYSFLSNECVDFLYKLLQGYPEQRLGHKNGITEIKAHYWLINLPWKQLEERTFESPLEKFVENFMYKNSLGEQHYINLNKRELDLREKEQKAMEIWKNSINQHGETDLSDNFDQFKTMKVNIIEEEINYVQMEDAQGSTKPDQLPNINLEGNYFNKKQTTPSIGGPTNSNYSNKDQDEQMPEVKTLKEHERTNKNMRMGAGSPKRQTGDGDSFAIIDEIVQNDDVTIENLEDSPKRPSNNKVKFEEPKRSRKSKLSKRNTRESKAKAKLDKENEVPLLTEVERVKIDDFKLESVISDKSAFVLTPTKTKVKRDHGIHIPATRKIKCINSGGKRLTTEQ